MQCAVKLNHQTKKQLVRVALCTMDFRAVSLKGSPSVGVAPGRDVVVGQQLVVRTVICEPC